MLLRREIDTKNVVPITFLKNELLINDNQKAYYMEQVLITWMLIGPQRFKVKY